jgi:hypothetical protein
MFIHLNATLVIRKTTLKRILRVVSYILRRVHGRWKLTLEGGVETSHLGGGREVD